MASHSLVWGCLLFLSCASQAGCSRILLVPAPHYSHVNLFSVAGRALSDAGHEVYVLTIFNFEPAVKKYELDALLHTPADGRDYYTKMEPMISALLKGSEGIYKVATSIFPLVSGVCSEINGNEKLMKKVESLKFDLVISDGFVIFSCLYIIPYRFGIPYITLSAMTDPWTHGVTTTVAVEPMQGTPFTSSMSFFERMMNLLPYLIIYINPFSYMYSESMLAEFAPHKPKTTFRQLARDSEIVLLIGDVNCVDYPRMSAPHYRFVGGTSAKPAKPLPADLEEFAQGAEHGVVILSFGSIKFLHSIWPKIRTKFMGAFSRLPQRFIVQYSLDDVTDAPPNVKLVKWLPQNDLLGHPKTKLFITHGGNNGQLEAMYHGVPLLTVPFAGDQAFNGARAAKREYGLMVDKYEITEDELYEHLKELLTNPKYTANIKKCSEIIKSLPSATDSVVFWVNHVLRFGGSHLKPPTHLGLLQMLMVDVWFFIFCVLLMILVFWVLCCRCVYRTCCRSKPKVKSE